MRNRFSMLAASMIIGAAAAVTAAVPAQAAQIDLWNSNQCCGYDYRSSSDTTFRNNVYNNGVSMFNSISYVQNFSSTANLCTVENYLGTCMYYSNGYKAAAHNEDYESILF